MNSGSSPVLTSRAGPTPVDPAVEAANAAINQRVSDFLYIICGAVALSVIIWKVSDIVVKYTRHVVCLNNDRQRYFAIPSPTFSFIKKHILYAPVFSKRHNREFQFSSAVNVGTLPTRFQLSFLTVYFICNVVFSVIDVPFQDSYSDVARVVRNRTGVLSVINMVCCFTHVYVSID